MLAYLVLAGHDGAPVDPDLIARFDQDDPPEVPFHSEERIVWRSPDSRVVFLGWQAFTDVAGIGSHWTIDKRGLTAFTGHCWPHTTGWVHGTKQNWAEQLRDYLENTSEPAVLRESLFGHFTIVSLAATGNGWIMPDCTSVDQLFVSTISHGMAISNRAGLCARAAQIGNGIPARSLTAAGWIMSEGWSLDQETGFWDVERPRAGSLVLIDLHENARVVEPAISPIYPPHQEIPPPTYEEVLDEVEQDLRNTIRAVANLPVEHRVLSLSGGKDSRTLLALILSEGVQDRFQFITHGSPERADVILAKAIADRYHLDWSMLDPSTRSAASELENVQLYTALVEGMTSAWTVMERPTFAPGVALNGTSGEGLRWGKVSSSAVGARTLDEVLLRIRGKAPLDTLGVLRSEVLTYYTDFVADWFHEHAERGIPLVSLPALYFHEGRMHARVGPDAIWNSRLRTDPFMTPVCFRANHRLSVERRPDVRFHLDLQRHACLELSKMPFTSTAWTESMYGQLPDAEDYRQLQPVSTRDPRGRTWRVRNYAAYLPMIEEIVLDRSNPIHELLDYDRLVERLAHGGEHEGRTRLLWGVLTAAVWMGHHELPIKLTRSG